MARSKHHVTFYTYPKFIFTWPIILMGLLLWPVSHYNWLSPEPCAWIYAVTAILVLITMGIDLSRNHAVFWLVLIAAFWILTIWLRDVKSVTFFSKIYDMFANLDPQYSKSLGLLVSIPLAFVYVIMWIWTRINSKWRVTHNEIEHYQFGQADDSIARGAKRIQTSYPDLFELLICLAGDLVIFDSTGKRELRRIPHVPLLPFVKKRINYLLELTAVTADKLEDEIEETPDDDRGL